MPRSRRAHTTTAEAVGGKVAGAGRGIATASRWAKGRAVDGSTSERRFAAGGLVVATMVLALLVGALAVLAVRGNGLATFAVIVVCVLLGMVLFAAVTLSGRGAAGGAALTAPVKSAVDEDERLLARELRHAAEVLGLGGEGWMVGQEALARWVGVPPETLHAWIAGEVALDAETLDRVGSFIDMAGTMEDNLRPERLPAILATRPVLMLGGRTYFQALNDGAPLDVVADSARLTLGGEHVETAQGQRYANRQTPVLWEPEPAAPKPRTRRAKPATPRR